MRRGLRVELGRTDVGRRENHDGGPGPGGWGRLEFTHGGAATFVSALEAKMKTK
jgi:hypothetical protein